MNFLRRVRAKYPLPFNGRGRVGTGIFEHVVISPIPLPTSPLKGEDKAADDTRQQTIEAHT